MPADMTDPDLVMQVSIYAFVLRFSKGWDTYWIADTGVSRVALAIDSVDDPIPVAHTKACARRWCDKCPGTMKPRSDAGVREPCACTCHLPTSPA